MKILFYVMLVKYETFKSSFYYPTWTRIDWLLEKLDDVYSCPYISLVRVTVLLYFMFLAQKNSHPH